jgi:hypothetical protein
LAGERVRQEKAIAPDLLTFGNPGKKEPHREEQQ